MKRLKDEKGYALILVLGMIVVITIMSVPLMNQVISSASQTKITENNIQLDKMVDMGLIYFKKELDIAIQEIEEESVQQDDPEGLTKDTLESKLISNNNRVVTISNQSSETFSHQTGYLNIIDMDRGLIVTFYSIGRVGEETSKSVSTILIEMYQNGESTNPPLIDYDDPLSNSEGEGCSSFDLQTTYQFNKNCTITGDFLIEKETIVNGNTYLCIEGTVYFTKKVKLNGRNAIIYFTESVIFGDEIVINGNGENIIQVESCP